MLLFFIVFQVPDLVFFYFKHNFYYFNCCSNTDSFTMLTTTRKVCCAKCKIINKVELKNEEPPKFLSLT